MELIGQCIGDYRVLKSIGAGGMGQVYLAENVHHKKIYALKVMPDELAKRPDFRHRFFDEARVMSELDHPNIVRVHHIGEHEGIYYLVMDYVEGPAGESCSLHDMIKEKSHSRLDPDQAYRWLVQIAGALAYAHKRGVVHRDIKPANILLTRDGMVKLTDFGLARAVGSDFIMSQIHNSLRPERTLNGRPTMVNTLNGQPTIDSGRGASAGSSGILGTYDYMSPEQHDGLPADERSDIYSFGVMAYRLLTGRRPVGIANPPTKEVAGLNPRWDEIVAKCLRDKPEERYDSEELVQALRGINAGKGGRLAAVLIVLALVGIAGAFWVLKQNGIIAGEQGNQEVVHQEVHTPSSENLVISPSENYVKPGANDGQQESTEPITSASPDRSENNIPDTQPILPEPVPGPDPEMVRLQNVMELNRGKAERAMLLALSDQVKAECAGELTEAGQLMAQAKNMGGDYVKAAELYSKAEKLYLKLPGLAKERIAVKQAQLKEMVVDARHSCEEALKGYDLKLWETYGGDKWKALQGFLNNASNSGQDYQKALENYGKAMTLIPEVERYSQEQYKEALWKQAQGSFNSGQVSEALSTLDTLLALDGTHAQGLALKALIVDSASPQAGETAVNSIGMELIWIPRGDYLMGSPNNEPGRDADEGPQHKVRLSKGFYIGVCEVTQEQFRRVMGYNDSNFRGDKNPANNVSWKEAVQFCQKLSEMEGKSYSLPTEAQWEYVCRAGSSTRYSCGDDDVQLSQFADYSRPYLDKGGRKKPNAWGVCDMHGSVWEWCLDGYRDKYDTQELVVDPPAVSQGDYRVVRGGSWKTKALNCRAAERSREKPGEKNDETGFRVILIDDQNQ